jgi:hypothetical protein
MDKRRQKLTIEEREAYKSAILQVLTRHIGRNNAISMGRLYRLAFREEFADVINDTRLMRSIITELRDAGNPICSTPAQSGGGYYLSSAGSELKDYCVQQRKRALKILAREAVLRKITVPELLGQIQMELTEAA